MHILLRPVPGLSATLERRQATFLVAAAKCTNIDSAIPRQAPPAITGNKMAPRGTRKNALLATWTRGCLARVASAPAGTGAGSTLAPHRSLPAAVVAAPSLRRSRTPSPRRTSSQPPAMTQVGGHHAARRQRWRPFPDRLPRAACSPDLSAARNLAVTGRSCRGLGTGDRKAGMDPHSAFRSSRATARSRSLRAGWAERGAFRPPGYSAGTAECSVSSRPTSIRTVVAPASSAFCSSSNMSVAKPVRSRSTRPRFPW